jgi:hypothetical protein
VATAAAAAELLAGALTRLSPAGLRALPLALVLLSLLMRGLLLLLPLLLAVYRGCSVAAGSCRCGCVEHYAAAAVRPSLSPPLPGKACLQERFGCDRKILGSLAQNYARPAMAAPAAAAAAVVAHLPVGCASGLAARSHRRS